MVEVEWRRTAQFHGAELEIIGYKGLPAVDGRSLGEHCATEIPTVAAVVSAWHLDRGVALFDTRPQNKGEQSWQCVRGPSGSA